MSRYFFDIQNGGLIEDDTGSGRPSAYAARDAAIRILPLAARQELPGGCCHEVSVVMRGMTGKPLFKASLSLRTEWLSDPKESDAVPVFGTLSTR